MVREARIAEMHGNSEGARKLLELATQDYPDEIGPLIALVRHHQEHKTAPEDLVGLRGLLIQRLADPEHPVPPGTLDYLVYQAGVGEEEAHAILGTVNAQLASRPDDYRLLEAAGSLQERLQLTEEAHATLRKMLELKPDGMALWSCLALDREEENWSEAAAHFKAIVEREPAPMFRMGYIEMLGKLGDYEKIVAELDNLDISTASSSGMFRQNLSALLAQVAWDLRDLGSADRAEAMFRRILEVDSKNHDVRRTILYLYSSAEERAAHEAQLNQRLEEESDPYRLLEQGAARLASHDFVGALDLLQRAASALPDSEVAWFNLGVAASRMENWEAAAEALGHAVTLNPERAEGWLNRGIALQNLKRCNEAIPVLEGALARQAGLGQAHYYLYVCHRNLGDEAAANSHLADYNETLESGN